MSKRSLVEDGLEQGEKVNESSSPKKKRTAKDAKPLDPKKYGGKTEEEVCQMLLPDHMCPGLEIIFMGINPGLYSAYMGHHYCNANNHFWPCLFESGLVPRKLGFRDDAECLNYGIGMSNIVPRTTRAASELSRKEIKEWSKVMTTRMQELKPLIICFNGKGIYEIFSGAKCTLGIQKERFPGTDIVVYVMPSTSGRAATYPKRSDKLKFFSELKDLRDRLQGKRAGENTATATPCDAADPQTITNDGNQNCTMAGLKESSNGDGVTAVEDVRPHRVAVIVGSDTTGSNNKPAPRAHSLSLQPPQKDSTGTDKTHRRNEDGMTGSVTNSTNSAISPY